MPFTVLAAGCIDISVPAEGLPSLLLPWLIYTSVSPELLEGRYWIIIIFVFSELGKRRYLISVC